MRPKTLQDGARKGQEGAKTLPRQLRIASKTPSKRVQMPLRPQKMQKKAEISKNRETIKELQRLMRGLGDLIMCVCCKCTKIFKVYLKFK